MPVHFHFSKTGTFVFRSSLESIKHSSLTFRLLTKPGNMNVKVHLDGDDVDALQGGALMRLLYERREFFFVRIYLYACGLLKKNLKI